MRFDVTFRNTRPREDAKRRVESLFGKIERFFDPAGDANCVIARENDAFTVELTANAFGESHQISDTDDDLRTALDRAFHRLETSLRRSKEKRVDRWHADGERKDGFSPADAS